jgi:hypothetical protein
MVLLSIFERQKGLLVSVLGVYVLSIAVGLIIRRFAPRQLLSHLERDDANKSGQVEKVFGRYRQSLREGDLRTIAICTGLVFTFNLLADFVQFTLLSIFIIPRKVLLTGGSAIPLRPY